MRKLIAAAAAIVWAGAALAGDYHQSSTLKCSECHTMHASRAHGLQSSNALDNIGWFGNPAIPNEKLLIQAGVNVTCLACHNNTAAPDVFGANEAGPALNVRSAGALNGTVTGHSLGAGGYQDWMGHTLGSSAMPPGFGGATWDPAAEGFHCGNCHSVHGQPNAFRNLGGPKAGTDSLKATFGLAVNIPTFNEMPATGPRSVAADANLDVFVNNVARTYATGDVNFQIGNEASGPRMNQYCGVCHGDYHGAAMTEAATPGHFIRHPTSGQGVADANSPSTDLPTATNAVVLARPLYNSGKTDAQTGCLTCHKGHGNGRGFGIVYPAAANAVNANLENGDAPVDGTIYPIRNLCTVCHLTY